MAGKQQNQLASEKAKCIAFKDKITVANAAILDTFQKNNMIEKIHTNNTWLV